MAAIFFGGGYSAGKICSESGTLDFFRRFSGDKNNLAAAISYRAE